MNITMLPQAASAPSPVAMPARRYASVATIGTDVRDRADQATARFAQGAVPGTSAWSPPTG